MKNVRTIPVISFTGILVIIFSSFYSSSADDCRVLLETISGSYEGGCKKGLAHGEGKSTGADSYEGNFRKGLPHGSGKYISSSGTVYDGDWKDGKKWGSGKLTFTRKDQSDSLATGYWYEDEFIGDQPDPYSTRNRSSNVSAVKFKRLSTSGNIIELKASLRGKPVQMSSGIRGSFGIIQSQTNFVTKILVEKDFPISGTIQFIAQTTVSTTGNPGTMEGSFDFDLALKGQWEVTMELTQVGLN